MLPDYYLTLVCSSFILSIMLVLFLVFFDGQEFIVAELLIIIALSLLPIVNFLVTVAVFVFIVAFILTKLWELLLSSILWAMDSKKIWAVLSYPILKGRK